MPWAVLYGHVARMGGGGSVELRVIGHRLKPRRFSQGVHAVKQMEHHCILPIGGNTVDLRKRQAVGADLDPCSWYTGSNRSRKQTQKCGAAVHGVSPLVSAPDYPVLWRTSNPESAL